MYLIFSTWTKISLSPSSPLSRPRPDGHPYPRIQNTEQTKNKEKDDTIVRARDDRYKSIINLCSVYGSTRISANHSTEKHVAMSSRRSRSHNNDSHYTGTQRHYLLQASALELLYEDKPVRQSRPEQ